MFIVEQAHWYYEDHCRDADPSLPSLSLRVFAHSLAAHCPDAFSTAFGKRGNQQQTTALIHDIDAAMAQFNAFKARVPTAGAALLDPTLTKVLMVKGYKKDASWGFPRGKLSKGETASECAAREVLEETGIDISGLVDDGASPRIEVDVGSQATTLFIVAGAASEETPVAALVRGEIGDIAWHLLADLPSTREAGLLTYKTAAGVKHRFWRVSVFLFFLARCAGRYNSLFFSRIFYLSRLFDFSSQVWPYIKPLRRWVKSQQKGGGAGGGARGGERATETAPKEKRPLAKKSKSSGALDAAAAAAAAAGPSTSKATTPASQGKKAKDASTKQQRQQRERGPRRTPAPAAAAEHRLAAAAEAEAEAPAPGKAWTDFSFDGAPILAALRG